MHEEYVQLIKELLAEDKSYNEVRAQFISRGWDATGLMEEYNKLAGETQKGISTQKYSFEEEVVVQLPAPTFFSLVVGGCKAVITQWRSVLYGTFFLLLPVLFWGAFPSFTGPTVSFELYLGLIAFGVLVTFACVSFCTNAFLFVLASDVEGVSFFHGVQWGIAHIFSTIWIAISRSILSVIGLLLCVVPGIVLYLFGSITATVFVREKTTGIIALLRSVDLVKSTGWKVNIHFFLYKICTLILLVSYVYAAALLPPLLFFLPLLLTIFIIMGISGNTTVYQYGLQKSPFFDSYVYRKLKWFLRLLVVIGVVCALAALAAASMSVFNQVQETRKMQFREPVPVTNEHPDGLSIDDQVLQKQVDSRKISAVIYKSKITTYEGVCKGVGVQPPISCKESLNSFVMQARMSNGEVYCVDSEGSSVLLSDPVQTAKSCLTEL